MYDETEPEHSWMILAITIGPANQFKWVNLRNLSRCSSSKSSRNNQQVCQLNISLQKIHQTDLEQQLYKQKSASLDKYLPAVGAALNFFSKQVNEIFHKVKLHFERISWQPVFCRVATWQKKIGVNGPRADGDEIFTCLQMVICPNFSGICLRETRHCSSSVRAHSLHAVELRLF